MSLINAQLLATKTRRPQLPLDWVARPRLSDKMNEALLHKLVLLSAPAGYGKTTLVVEALRDFNKPVGWVSLDAGDNIPGSFLAYFITALQNVVPAICQPVLNALQSPQPPPIDLLLTAVINSVSGHEDEIVLVLDDYHTIESKAVHEAMSFMVEHLPLQVHLVIASRIDPPLSLSRWRVKGDLVEIRADELSFTTEEAAVFLKNGADIALSEQDLATLESRTEGWIAGLKMAALSLRGKKDISGFIDAFSGNHHYILDYLAEEVLNRQPSSVKQFLLETSVLERMCSHLCDAVTERTDSQSMLVQLELANLFIAPLDDERRWYRYHQLFATILQNQLAKSAPERINLLRHRASVWYEKEGLIEEAIDHALMGGNAERAADLLETLAPHILSLGQVPKLLEYLPHIPESFLPARPVLSVSFAWAAILSSKWELVSTMLARVNAALADNPEKLSPFSQSNLRDIKGHMLSIQGYVAQAQGDIHRSIRLAEEANRELAEDNLLTRCSNLQFLAISYLKTGDIAKAIPCLEEANALGHKSGNRAIVLSSRAYLAEMEMQRSQFDRAAETCKETIELGVRWGGACPLPYTALAYVVHGQLKYEQNDLEGAAKDLTEGIELAEANFNWTTTLKGCLLMAKLSQALGRSKEAIEYSRHAEDVAPRAPQAREGRQIPAWKALLALRQGDIATASDWAWQQEVSLPLASLPDYLKEFDYLILVRLKLNQGEYHGLPMALDGVIQRAESQGRSAALVEMLVLKSIALDCLDESVDAEETLDRALSLAEQAGYVRTFIDEGTHLAGLLSKVIAKGKHVDYASRLLGLITSQSQDKPMQSARRETAQGLIEALSERELEVLELIAAGKSNKEVASELFLAIGTVKKHINNIFGKLGAKSRTQAIARARELGII